MAFAKSKAAATKAGTAFKSKELQQGAKGRLKKAKVVPTGIPGLDKLILEPFSSVGGLPIGRGKITLLGGDPGSGKTRLGINIATKLLKEKQAFLYVGFEMESDEFVGQVYDQYKHLYEQEPDLEKIYYLDYYCSPFKAVTDIPNLANRALEFNKKTGSPFVFIDSITAMVSMETMLRSTMDKLSDKLYQTGAELAVVGVSQFRGSYDRGIAGGKGMSHKGTAVMLLEAEEITNFNKAYMPQYYKMGDLVRTVRVIKTMNYAHPIHKFIYTIDDFGVFQFSGETLSTLANKKVTE